MQPIECNPRAHTAVVLFTGVDVAMTKAYLGALRPQINGVAADDEMELVTPVNSTGIYWIGHDVVTLVLYPLLAILQGKMTVGDYLRGCITFFEHLLFWKDGTFEIWDPLPWWWLYHVFWPGKFLWSIIQRRKWSRINVGTTKMFEC